MLTVAYMRIPPSAPARRLRSFCRFAEAVTRPNARFHPSVAYCVLVPWKFAPYEYEKAKPPSNAFDHAADAVYWLRNRATGLPPCFLCSWSGEERVLQSFLSRRIPDLLCRR